MREVTLQVVLKLNDTTDATARILEASARDWANGQLFVFDSDETASVAILMDRVIGPPIGEDGPCSPVERPLDCLSGPPCGDPHCPCCSAPFEQCYDCGAINEDASKPWATKTVDTDPGDPEVGPRPCVMDASFCPACTERDEKRQHREWRNDSGV